MKHYTTRGRLILAILVFASVSVLYSQEIYFTNSIVAGGVTSSAARFWIRSSAPATVNIQLSTDPAFSESINGVPVIVTEESNNAGIVNAADLKPDTKYYYRGVINDSVPGQELRYFYTFPEEGALKNFSFGFGSCQQNGGPLSPGSSPGIIYNEIVKHAPKFFLQIGDWTYPDYTDNAPYDNNFFSNDYRRVQQTYTVKYDSSYPMDTLFRIAPVDYVYDDHDYINNNCSALSVSVGVPYRPNPFGSDFAFLEIPAADSARTNSIKGYRENFPGYPLANESRGIYHKFTYGNAEFFVVDLRSQRSPNLEVFSYNEIDTNWVFNPPAGHSILGRDNAPGSGESQFTWFLNSLLNSKADWKFIVSSVPFNKAQNLALNLGLQLQDFVLPVSAQELPPGSTGIFASMEFADKWPAFPQDQDSVLNFIAANEIKNVIVLSGDAHTSAIDDGANAGLPEIMAANLDIENSRIESLLGLFGINMWNQGGQGVSGNNFNTAFGRVNVYGRDSVNLALIDNEGTFIAQYTINNSSPVSVQNNSVITGYSLRQNYPNPFNPSTNINYSLAEPGLVTVKIFNMLGEEVETLINKFENAGQHSLTFNADALAAGVYFCRLQSGEYTSVIKMMLVK